MDQPREWLNCLSARYRMAFGLFCQEQSKTETIRLEVADRFTDPDVMRLVRQSVLEGRAQDRYRDAHRDYVAFLEYMKENNLL